MVYQVVKFFNDLNVQVDGVVAVELEQVGEELQDEVNRVVGSDLVLDVIHHLFDEP